MQEVFDVFSHFFHENICNGYMLLPLTEAILTIPTKYVLISVLLFILLEAVLLTNDKNGYICPTESIKLF